MQGLSIDRLKKNYPSITTNLNNLQKALPALPVGLLLLLSFLAKFHLFFSLFCLLLWVLLTGEWKRNILYFFLGSIFLIINPPPLNLDHPLHTAAIIEIDEVNNTNKGVQYKAIIKGLVIDQKVHLMNQQLFFLSKNYTLSQSEYLIEGTYIQKNPHLFTLTKIKNIKKLSDLSFYKQIKSYLLKKLHPHLKIQSQYKHGESLLLACLFGTTLPKEIKILFSKLGLSHILAISGFHFSIVALFIHSVFSLFFPKRIVQITLLVILTLYFIMIGASSSIFRAYITLLLGIIGSLFSRKKTALNLLFVTFIIAFCIDPYSLQNAAFQLSYLATFGIIAFCPILETTLDQFLPKRTFKEAKKLQHFAAICYIILQIFKKIFCVNISAFLFTLPIILTHFQMVSLLGLIYNLFIPCFIGIALSIGLIAFILKAFFGLSFLYIFITKQLDGLISFLFYYPRKWDFVFYQDHFRVPFAISLEILLVFGTLFLYLKQKNPTKPNKLALF